MTTRPRFATDVNYVNGAAAVALFAVLAYVFFTAELGAPRGFGEGSITATIGYAMFDLLELIPEGHGETEGFLVAFLIVAVVLDAALDGALMLARREEGGSVVTAIADGGRRLVDDESDSATAGSAANDGNSDDRSAEGNERSPGRGGEN